MPVSLIKGDITKMHTDAIVNAANESLLGGGGVDGAIHRAAGPELLKECIGLNGCRTGEAKATKGYRLPAQYVIQTVGPIWQGGTSGEENLLRSAYRNSLKTAAELGVRSIAFPLISSGAYGYPKSEALRIALSETANSDEAEDMEIYIVLYGDTEGLISRDLETSIGEYLRDNLEVQGKMARFCDMESAAMIEYPSLEDAAEVTSETFSEKLLRLTDEKGMTDSEVYKNAGIDRRLFSKIRCSRNYRPSRNTAISLALALKLTPGEADDFLKSAGFALSKSSRADLIISWFLEKGTYSVMDVKSALFEFGEDPLGQ